MKCKRLHANLVEARGQREVGAEKDMRVLQGLFIAF
jgi:hypothetical protein